MRGLLLAAALLGCVACGYQPPKECGYTCRQQLVDGGCFAGPPICGPYPCGGPICPERYDLVEDAGARCDPMPVEDRPFCV